MRSLLSPILFQEVFGHADIDEIPWKKLIHGAFPHGVKLNIHSGICKCLHPFSLSSFRSRNHTDIPDGMLLRSPFQPCGPRGQIHLQHCDICLVPVIFQTFFCSTAVRIHALQSLHGECILHLETSVPTGTG